MNSIAIFSFCTHLTFDLIMRLGHISRHGCGHTSRNTISMDATFYSILPLKDFFFFSLNGLSTMMDFTAAGVVPCGGRKTSPRTSTIVQFIFYFGPLRSAIIF